MTRQPSDGRAWRARAAKLGLALSMFLASTCGAPPPGTVGELNQAVLDESWWQNPLFQGSKAYKFNDGHTWYDSDVGGGYVTGSRVRLPVDSNYIGDWSTGPVYCKGGGTSSFWSPVFETTVNGKKTTWVFNHLSQSFLGANGRTKGLYNGGALVGLTGGGTCDTGMPTFSTGPHFCNEMRDYDPYTYWHPVPDYSSNCGGSNGTSGVANPVCGGMQKMDPCRGASNGNGLYCGAVLPGGDASKLYDCQNGGTASATPCACGCMQNPNKVPDACKANCNDPCSSAKLGNGTYCGGGLTNGEVSTLYDCQNNQTASKTLCKCGCMVNPPKVPDVCAMTCAPEADMAMPPPTDMAFLSSDLSPTGDGAMADGATADPGHAVTVSGGCDLAQRRSTPPMALFAILFSALLAIASRHGLRRRRR